MVRSSIHLAGIKTGEAPVHPSPYVQQATLTSQFSHLGVLAVDMRLGNASAIFPKHIGDHQRKGGRGSVRVGAVKCQGLDEHLLRKLLACSTCSV